MADALLAWLLAGLVLAGTGGYLIRRGVKAARRRRLVATPLPAAARRFLLREVPLYRGVPAALRPALDARINVFLDEKRFVGCRGQVVSEEMRLLIAAQACLLILARPDARFPGFTTILVHPDTYVAEEVRHDGGIEHVERHVRSGEAWERGPVVLSWADVAADTRHAGDGCNVVLHEFAHKLDDVHEGADGLPRLRDPAQYERWARVFSREYAALVATVDAGRPTVLDPYGAESPAEFFAVVTESFFEQPAALAAGHPELYAELSRYYGVDPARWEGAGP